MIQNNKNVKNTKEAQKIAVITDYLNRTGASTYENGIGTNPSKTTSTSNSTITIGGTTVSTGNSSSYSYTNEKYLNESSNNQKPSILNSIWNGVKSIGSDIGSMVSQVPGMIKAGADKFSKDPVGAVVDLIVSPIKQVVNEGKTILNGLGEIGEAIGYAMDGDWEAAGKSALSGVTNVIGGATSIAIVASTVLVAFNPVTAAVIAGYAMYGGIAESGLGLTQNIVGQMTNDSDYAKKGTMHFVSGTIKAFSAKGIQKLANKRISEISKLETNSNYTSNTIDSSASKKSIVIGEGMDDIKIVAKKLQEEGVDAKWYQAWKKNFPLERKMTMEELGSVLKRNKVWIESKIKQGYDIYDIGLDPNRVTRSPFYDLEISILKKHDYPIIDVRNLRP